MTNSLMTMTKKLVCGVALTFVISILAGSAIAQEKTRQDGPRQPSLFGIYDLTGVWQVTITPGDGGPSFVGFYSFGIDGNASFSSAGPPIPGLGNPGYGVWKRKRVNTFESVIKMISYTENFQFDGTLKIRATIRMTSPNRFETSDAVTIYDPAGNEVVTFGGNAVGKRIEIDD